MMAKGSKSRRFKVLSCPKCGSRDIFTRFHTAHEISGFEWEHDGCGVRGKNWEGSAAANQEHLFRHCRGCQFDWRDPTLTRHERG